MRAESDSVRRQRLKVFHRQVVDACKANQPDKVYASYQRWLAIAEHADNFSLVSTQALRALI